VLACFPVYRSYLPEGREHLDQALAAAREHRPDLASVLDALAPVLGDPASPPALRVQQTSGMVMAKGVEDQSFYRWSRLTSLNEVGADPATFAVTPDAFHAAMLERQRDWPTAMTTLSTHDTKRSEDVRARLAVLAEVPGLWRDALTRLLELAPVPDPGFGSLLWQAALGARPIERERLHAYARRRCARPVTTPAGCRRTRRTSPRSTPPSTRRTTTRRWVPCSTGCSTWCSSPAAATRWPPSWWR
jgi:(1->4)-alpha-D-glucan 1-alpha-D-glucosylmutase